MRNRTEKLRLTGVARAALWSRACYCSYKFPTPMRAVCSSASSQVNRVVTSNIFRSILTSVRMQDTGHVQCDLMIKTILHYTFHQNCFDDLGSIQNSVSIKCTAELHG